MWWLLAAELPEPPPDTTGQYLIFFGVCVSTLGLIVVAYLNRPKADRNNTPTSPIAPTGPPEDIGTIGVVRERVAVTESQIKGLSDELEEVTEIVEILDRRVVVGENDRDHVIRFLDRRFPGWRSGSP